MACIKAAMQEVSLVVQLHSRGLLAGCHWSIPSVTFSAVMTLLMSILANSQDPKAYERLEAADKGTKVLLQIASNCRPFEKCLSILTALIRELKSGLNERVIPPQEGTSTMNLDMDQDPLMSNIGAWPAPADSALMPTFFTDVDTAMYDSRSSSAYSALDFYDTLNGSEDPPYPVFGPGGAYIG
ncbi:Gypsy retrotransposon integrase-like protein 1 [Paecilomyces lecythidis]